MYRLLLETKLIHLLVFTFSVFSLLTLCSSSSTIKVTSSLFDFRRDTRFDSILKDTYPQTLFTNYSQFQSLLSLAISSEPINSMRNIVVYIEGKFEHNQVTVSHGLILYYQSILESWYQLKGAHQFRLELWLRGEGSGEWIEHSKDKLDFDEVEIVAVSGLSCRLFGKLKYNLTNCNTSEIIYHKRVIDGAVITQHTLKQEKQPQRSIVNINYALKIYINHTSKRVIAFGKDYFEYGSIIEYNETIPLLKFQRFGREIAVNSTTLVSEYQFRPLAEVYNCVNRSIYYGGWKNGAFDGMGYEIAERTQYKYMGVYQNGNKHGKGIVVICNKNLSSLCDRVLSTRTLNTSEDLYSGNIFIGDFENNWRKAGVHRKSHQLELGRYVSYYNTTHSDRLYLTMKLSGFSIRYSLQVYNGYAERRLLGLFIDGVLNKGYVQTCYLRTNDNQSVLVPEYNSTGIFNSYNEVDRGVRWDLDIVAFGDFFVNAKKMIVMTRKSQMSNEISELYYGNVDEYNKKHGKSIAYTENYSYFGEFEDDFINGYGNKTDHTTNISYQGYFRYQRFIQGVSIQRVGKEYRITEGYFINNKPTSNSITYTTGSHLLTQGNNKSHHVISTGESDHSQGQESGNPKHKTTIVPSTNDQSYFLIQQF